MHIAGQTFLVGGGASGLGAACVRRLVQAGARVLIADINAEAAEQLAAELGEHVRAVRTDISDEASVLAALQAAQALGPLRGVVNCAGIATAERALGKQGPLALAAFARVININLNGTFNVVRLAAALMAEQEPLDEGERGVIINTASIAAFDGQIGQAAYAASKGGIVSMTLPLARELARYGIRVVTIAPGLFDTPLMAGLPEAARQSLAQQVPFPPRLGRPDEFAALVEHIVQNSMLNGEVIRLDGALRMAAR